MTTAEPSSALNKSVLDLRQIVAVRNRGDLPELVSESSAVSGTSAYSARPRTQS